MATPDPAPKTDRQTVTVAEAGRRLGVGRGLAYELARRGEIPAIRLGRRLVVPIAALDRLLNGGGPVSADPSVEPLARPDDRAA